MDEALTKDLIRKYKWAGKIRFVSFALLFVFLSLMKMIGGYSYLNIAFISLIFVEAVLNQPYNFFLRRINIYRFQFYQMLTDIIVISWVLYFMGGLEAPVVSIAYYAVILWAGVVSGTPAVCFAVGTSCIFFSSIVILEYLGLLPAISHFDYKIPAAQMLSLLLGNVAFLFAFGYFSIHSSGIIKLLEEKRREESLKHTHKLLAAGYLIGGIAHDIIGHLISIRGYADLLLERLGKFIGKDKESDNAKALKRIGELERDSTELLYKLSQFSLKPKEKFEPADLNRIIDDSLDLTSPLAMMSHVTVERIYKKDLPLVMMNNYEMQEVFVALILNSLDAIIKKGKVIIKTSYLKVDNRVEVVLADTGVGIKEKYLSKIAKPFFTTKEPGKGLGLGLTIAYEIIARHKGSINVESVPGRGTTFTIRLPVA